MAEISSGLTHDVDNRITILPLLKGKDMNTSPYFDRLAEAYAILEGIPDEQVTLDIEMVSIAPEMASIGVKDGRYVEPANWDAMVITPDMWLSLCPPYIDVVWPLIENWPAHGIEVFWRIDDRLTGRFEIAMAHLFNLSSESAEDVFGMRGDDELDDRSDKQVVLDRIAAFLTENGQQLTVGTGHIAQDEMVEHGITPGGNDIADNAETAQAHAAAQAGSDRSAEAHTGFSAMALESDAPGAETLTTEAAGTSTSPVVAEQSVEQTPAK
jgi:hypothetical protein